MLIDQNGNQITAHRGGSIRGVAEADIQRMLDFIFGAVRAICADREGTQFAARDFLGGTNYFWEGTPMEVLFNKYVAEGTDEEGEVDPEDETDLPEYYDPDSDDQEQQGE